MQCAMCNVQCAMCNVQCAMCNVQCAMCNVQCTMYNVQCTMYNVQCGMWNVECGMWNVECGMWKLIIMLCHPFLLLDINECAQNNGGCEQGCTNTKGGYFCSCYQGYRLLQDNRTCAEVSTPDTART